MDNNEYQPESSASGTRRKDAKVAIPRIRGHDYHIPVTTRARSNKPRTEVVSRACTQCRKRKTKCSGDRPKCMNCEKQGQDCHYDQERKDRLRGAISKTQALTALLVEVNSQLDAESKKKVEDLLASFEDDTPPPFTFIPLNTPRGKRPRRASLSRHDDANDSRSVTSADGGEAYVPASVGSNEDLDLAQEDLLQSDEISKTGFMGRNSQVQWLRALEVKVEQPEGEPSSMPYGPPGSSSEAFNKRAEALHEREQRANQNSAAEGHFTKYNFYLDKNDIYIDVGDPHMVPSADTAHKLFTYYKVAVHSPFRFLDENFEAQVETYYKSIQDGVTINVCSKWKAMMNLMFAIGARYSHLIGAEWQADGRDHLVYMWRAVHLLELDAMDTLVSRPHQSLIQALGMLSFYYLVIGHVSRAWYTIGIAIRHAQAAGLHLRLEDPSTSADRKRNMARIWWTLSSTECVLTAITGRPRAIVAKDCTIPPPGAVETGMQTSPHDVTSPSSAVSRTSVFTGDTGLDSFDVAYIKLDILMDKILSGLYSARKSATSWKQVQGEMTSLLDSLDTWALQSLSHVPSGDATISKPDMSREQLLLYFNHQNAKICITRPCLCRLDQRIKAQSEDSARLNQKMAETCINTALNIASLLPEDPDPYWFYQQGPWWLATHSIMQGLTVLLLELSVGGVHLSIDKQYVKNRANKLMRWLRSMAPVDEVSERAYEIVAKVLNNQSQSQAMSDQIPHLPTEEHAQSANLKTQQQSHSGEGPASSHQAEMSWPSADALDSNSFYSLADTGNYYPNDQSASEYFNDPNAGLNEFGKPQMSLFYGNPYMEHFDQWQWDPAIFDEHDDTQTQDPSQGAGQGGNASGSQDQNLGGSYGGGGWTYQ